MGASTELFRVGGSAFRLNHLLIIGILALSFTMSLLIRAQVVDYGFELHEFDPFFNYRATEFLVQNGLSEYYGWHDHMSWYPAGRDVSATSQTALHLTTAATYLIFGGGMSLYDFAIIFPGVIGALTAVVVFALVRVVGGTTAGLFACLFYAVSVPVILRGTFGWLKSEPLGLFYGLLGVYLFLSGIRTADRRTAMAKLVGGGILLGFGLGSWGGIQFFIIPVGVLILALPFIRRDLGFLTYAIPVFVASLLLSVAVLFERPGVSFVTGVGGISLIAPTAFLVLAGLVRDRFGGPEKRIRNTSLLLIAVVVAGGSLTLIGAESGLVPMPSFRYLNAINPFLTTTDPLVDSVSEHATTTISHSFFMNSIFMIFGGIGAWLIFSRTRSARYLPRDMAAFALILGITGVYISSAFVRLEIFASISVIVLSSVGLAILTREIMHRRGSKDGPLRTNAVRASYAAAVILLVSVPLALPAEGNWISVVDIPPTILNGGTGFNVVTSDWKDTFEWIGSNTPQDAVVAAWWDYGYWITTMSNRTTLADNFTRDTVQIQNIARIFLSPPDEGWNRLQDMGGDYMLVFVAAEHLGVQNGEDVYVLAGGGDESKKQWFMRIAEEPLDRYLHSDGFSATEHFWKGTLIGNAFPFTLLAYVDPFGDDQSRSYVPGFTAVYTDDVKYPADGDGPLRLVYASSSFTDKKPGPVLGVFVYEVNDDYVPAVVASDAAGDADTTDADAAGDADTTDADAAGDADTTDADAAGDAGYH